MLKFIKLIPILCLGLLFFVKSIFPKFYQFGSGYLIFIGILILISVASLFYSYPKNGISKKRLIGLLIAILASIMISVYQYFGS
jgi:hypothetical protein